jgi:hypothetical protein
VRENGLFILREVSERIALELFSYYYDTRLPTYVTFVVASILILLMWGTFMPIVNGITREGSHLVSFFGMINTNDVREISNKADKYLDNFILSFSDKIDEDENSSILYMQEDIPKIVTSTFNKL